MSYSDGHLLGKMVAFGRFQVKCFQRKVFLYVGSVCLREVMSRSYTSQDIMSGFMSVNLKNKGSLFEVSEGFIKKQISHLLKSARRTIFCFVTKSVALRTAEIMFVCLFVCLLLVSVVVVDVAETYLKMRKLERKWLTISGTMIMPARRLTSFPCFPTFKSQKWTFHSYSWMQIPRLAIRK